MQDRTNRRMGRRTLLGMAIACFAVTAPLTSDAETVRRFQSLTESLVDVWTFVCPAGGKVTISVDTYTSQATAGIDPRMEVYDGNGNNLVTADDVISCTTAPACPAGGVECPEVVDLSCGSGKVHSIVLQNAGAASGCTGGQYLLVVKATDSNNTELTGKKLKLGGGAKRTVPKWLDPNKTTQRGPAWDDETFQLVP